MVVWMWMLIVKYFPGFGLGEEVGGSFLGWEVCKI